MTDQRGARRRESIKVEKVGEFDFQNEILSVVRTAYARGPTAVLLEGPGGYFATLSLYVETADLESDDEFVLNHDVSPSLERAAIDAGVFEYTGRTTDYGFVLGRPIARLLMGRGQG